MNKNKNVNEKIKIREKKEKRMEGKLMMIKIRKGSVEK